MNRGVWQCKSLLIRYCPAGGSSVGVRCERCIPILYPYLCVDGVYAMVCRQWLEEHLVTFAKANPHMEIAVNAMPNRHPVVRGWYMRDNDGSKVLSLRNLSAAQMMERVHFLRDVRPVGLRKWGKQFRTTPSIQGDWHLGQRLDQPHRVLRA